MSVNSNSLRNVIHGTENFTALKTSTGKVFVGLGIVKPGAITRFEYRFAGNFLGKYDIRVILIASNKR